jgi:hypothetical protein
VRVERAIAHPRRWRRKPLDAAGETRKVRTPQGSAPGNARGFGGLPRERRNRRATESATENKPPAGKRLGGGREGNLPTAVQGRQQVRVKRRGKSSPPGWRHPGHGKPRAEQGQIGEPNCVRDRPGPRLSGRPHEPGSDSRPRGMIAPALCAFAKADADGAGQNPAYSSARTYLFCFQLASFA